MKLYHAISVNNLRRPIAVMLTLLPAGGLAFSYAMVYWVKMMTANGRMTDPNVSTVVEGFGALFRDYAIPVLMLSVILSVMNLWFALRVSTERVPAQ